MNRPLAIAVFSSALLVEFFIGCSDNTYIRDQVTRVDKNDAEMEAAIAKARSTLPHFWQVYSHRNRGEDDFSLKVKISDANGTEYFWLGDLAKKDGRLFGTIDNDPQIVDCVRLGDRLPIAMKDVVDWLYTRNGKMVGNYTVRALLENIPADEAEALKKKLTDP